jgi:monovalent cation/proton antiporter MnhG/PhaG subunit
MSATHWIAGALLAAGVAVELACCLGVAVARTMEDRLHYTGPATTLGALLICGAILVNESFSQGGIKAIIVAVVLVLANPVLVHVTARAARVRERGRWEALDREREAAR